MTTQTNPPATNLYNQLKSRVDFLSNTIFSERAPTQLIFNLKGDTLALTAKISAFVEATLFMQCPPSPYELTAQTDLNWFQRALKNASKFTIDGENALFDFDTFRLYAVKDGPQREREIRQFPLFSVDTTAIATLLRLVEGIHKHVKRSAQYEVELTTSYLYVTQYFDGGLITLSLPVQTDFGISLEAYKIEGQFLIMLGRFLRYLAVTGPDAKNKLTCYKQEEDGRITTLVSWCAHISGHRSTINFFVRHVEKAQEEYVINPEDSTFVKSGYQQHLIRAAGISNEKIETILKTIIPKNSVVELRKLNNQNKYLLLAYNGPVGVKAAVAGDPF